MAETLAALIFAHVLADFLFQTPWMVAHKSRLSGLAAHGAVVLALNLVALGQASPALLALTAAHLGIDLIKAQARRRGPLPFLADQAAHLATLAALALLEPGLWQAGLWADLVALPALMALMAGLVLATRAGGFLIALVMEPWAAATPQGLPGGGRAIGHLERALIFVLILTGQTGGIGFLIAAKSVLRFGAVGDDRAVSEYVIIGTLASFGWAIAASTGTLWLMQALTPLGIPVLAP